MADKKEYLSRLEVEESIKKLYSEIYANLKYYLITKNYCDIFKEDTYNSLEDYFYNETLDKKTDKYNLQKEDHNYRLLKYNYSLYTSSYDKLLETYIEYYAKVNELYTYDYVIDLRYQYNNEINIYASYRDKFESKMHTAKDSDEEKFYRELYEEYSEKVVETQNKLNEFTDHYLMMQDLYGANNPAIKIDDTMANNDWIAIKYYDLVKKANESMIKFDIKKVNVSLDNITDPKEYTLYIDKDNYASVYIDGKFVEISAKARPLYIDNVLVNDLTAEYDNKADQLIININNLKIQAYNTKISLVNNDNQLLVETRDKYTIPYDKNVKLYKNVLYNTDGNSRNLKIKKIGKCIGLFQYGTNNQYLTSKVYKTIDKQSNNYFDIQLSGNILTATTYNIADDSPVIKTYDYNWRYYNYICMPNYYILNRHDNKTTYNSIVFDIYYDKDKGFQNLDRNNPRLIIDENKLIYASKSTISLNDYQRTAKSINCINTHQIKYVDNDNNAHIVNVPNPNYTELIDFHIKYNGINDVRLYMNFKDISPTYDVEYDIADYEVGKLSSPIWLYPLAFSTVSEYIFQICYNNGQFKDTIDLRDILAIPFSMDTSFNDDGLTINYGYDGYKASKTISKADIYPSETIKTLSYDSDRHTLKFSYAAANPAKRTNGHEPKISGEDFEIIQDDITPNHNVAYSSDINYTYALQDETIPELSSNYVRLYENNVDTGLKFKCTEFDDIIITDITRDINNEQIVITYSDGSKSYYNDLVNKSFITNLYSINSYVYFNNVLTKSTYLNGDIINYHYDFRQYDNYLHRIYLTINENKNGTVIFKETNNFINELDIPNDNFYDITYDIKNYKLLYEYYGDLSLNKIINNTFLLCENLNLDTLHQTFKHNNSDRENSYNMNMNAGNGFSIIYDNYVVDLDSKVLTAHTIKNVADTDYLEVSSTRLMKFRGLRIELPVIKIQDYGVDFTRKDKNITTIYDAPDNTNIISVESRTVREKEVKLNDKNKIRDLVIDRKYQLYLRSNKQLGSYAELSNISKMHNKFLIRIDYYDYVSRDEDILQNEWQLRPVVVAQDYLSVDSDWYQDDIYTNIIKFAPKFENFDIYAVIYVDTGLDQNIETDFWGLQLIQTKELLMDKGLYVTL